jgi:hypothetical protein
MPRERQQRSQPSIQSHPLSSVGRGYHAVSRSDFEADGQIRSYHSGSQDFILANEAASSAAGTATRDEQHSGSGRAFKILGSLKP